MKMVIAFIKKNKFDDVMLALHKIEGLTGASSSEVHGFGRDRSSPAVEQKSEISLDFTPHIRLEIACRSELTEQVISTITGAAHTGLLGDGKIYVFSLDESVRIRTAERGESAV
ncbi:MAG TPA: P-II family nitrogen regulator [Anaerohalosphaeraceae bacterium]|nr:P-II family nitrogen regulator [Anaerohalosphaeraceae bacterium]